MPTRTYAGTSRTSVPRANSTGESHTADESIGIEDIEELITTVKGLALILADTLEPKAVADGTSG